MALDDDRTYEEKKEDYVIDVRAVSPRPDARSSISSIDEKDHLLLSTEDEFLHHRAERRSFEPIIDCLWILLNTVSTVAIVFLNKLVFNDPQLRNCQISIAAWHFLATFVVLGASTVRPFSFFKVVRIPLSSSLPLSVLFAGFLLLGNLSLAWNPVGFYQLSKVLNTPAVVLVGYLLLRRSVSRPVLAAVAAVCTGVALTNAQLAWSNPAGTAAALAAVGVTAVYQVWIAGRIAALQVSAPQLLFHQAGVAVLLLLALAPFVDVRPDFALIPSPTIYALLGSGGLAAGLNLSQFQVIARTSPLTFNIVSNLKTIVIVALSWYMDRHAMTLRDVAGVTLALGGAYAYAHAVQRPR